MYSHHPQKQRQRQSQKQRQKQKQKMLMLMLMLIILILILIIIHHSLYNSIYSSGKVINIQQEPVLFNLCCIDLCSCRSFHLWNAEIV